MKNCFNDKKNLHVYEFDYEISKVPDETTNKLQEQ